MKTKLGWIIAAVFGLLLAFNLTVWAPVASTLGKDDRNGQAMSMHVYRAWLLHPTDITVDLVRLKEAAPIDIMRGLFQASAALKDRKFSTVILARAGKPVFKMSGADFQELGRSYAAGENPIYLIRTLPESILLMDGSLAFGTWTGGWLGVLGKQMEDVTDFGEGWAAGSLSPNSA